MAHLIMIACDRCLKAGERVESAETVTVAFDRHKPRTLDLCAEHYKPYAELREFAESDGTTVKDAAPTSTRTRERQPLDATCPECGQATTARGLPIHIRMAHNRSATFTCPECGRELSTPQGLAIHRQSQHGVAKMSERES